MRGTTAIWIGLVLVALNTLVFGQEWIAYRAAAPGAHVAFPVWTLLTLLAACAYLIGAGLAFDRQRRSRK
jgi:hypothetical protein